MLFSFGILLILLAGNAVFTFMGWELAGISSYLLIAYNWQRPQAIISAQRAIITNRIGDAGFILALFSMSYFAYTTDWQIINSKVEQHTISTLYLLPIALGLFLAALIKSAQFPFSAWISRALEGPTPSSTLFYGTVMVHMGLYLLLRISPFLERSPALAWFLILLGILTVIYAWLTGLVQTDIKSSLLSATLLQVGLINIEIGFGLVQIAILHILLHLFWRSYQFLHAPSYMQLSVYRAPSAPRWLQQYTALQNAALQRFWLDPLADALLVRPTLSLAREAQLIEQHVIDRLTGHSTEKMNTSSTQTYFNNATASGFFGKPLQGLANIFALFEQLLLIKPGKNNILTTLLHIGHYLNIADHYLRQPRYLIVMIAITLIIVL